MNNYVKIMSLVSLVILAGLFNLAIAAAPSGPVEKTQEDFYRLSSVSAKSIIEQGYKRFVTVTVTAYSSTRDQTDSTPWITAANTPARDGVVAANFLPFYTKIKIPELFGDKTFVVEDRMHKRFKNRIDIWFPNRAQAKKFGIKKVKAQVF